MNTCLYARSDSVCCDGDFPNQKQIPKFHDHVGYWIASTHRLAENSPRSGAYGQKMKEVSILFLTASLAFGQGNPKEYALWVPVPVKLESTAGSVANGNFYGLFDKDKGEDAYVLFHRKGTDEMKRLSVSSLTTESRAISIIANQFVAIADSESEKLAILIARTFPETVNLESKAGSVADGSFYGFHRSDAGIFALFHRTGSQESKLVPLVSLTGESIEKLKNADEKIVVAKTRYEKSLSLILRRAEKSKKPSPQEVTEMMTESLAVAKAVVDNPPRLRQSGLLSAEEHSLIVMLEIIFTKAAKGDGDVSRLFYNWDKAMKPLRNAASRSDTTFAMKYHFKAFHEKIRKRLIKRAAEELP